MHKQGTIQVRQTSEIDDLIEKANAFVRSAKTPATLKAYRSDWQDFESWCRDQQLAALPATPQTVALYITDRASTLASGTITRRLTSITKAHQAAGYTDSPAAAHNFVVGETLKGIRRAIGTEQHGKDPLLTEHIHQIVACCPAGLLGLRDGALILTGFAGAFRRSELSAILVSDLKSTEEGIVVNLRKSKTDQEGAGRKVGLPLGSHAETCPVRALQRWLAVAGITEGPVFRGINRHGHVSKRGLHKDSIGAIIKRAALRAGYKVEGFAGHSLRAGHVTQGAMNGVSEFVIMNQTGHKSSDMLRKYIRLGKMFQQNSATGLGL